MMKSKNVFVNFMLLVLFVCGVVDVSTQKKTMKSTVPQNVVDYLKILPKGYSQILAANESADRLSLIKYDRRENNFLRIEAANFKGYAEIALFKKKSGGHLVAVNEYVWSSTYFDGGVVFYEYNKGKWKEVEPFPMFTYGDLLTAFHGKANRSPTEEEMNGRVYELQEPKTNEITLKIGGIAVYGFIWNGSDFESGMLYLLDDK